MPVALTFMFYGYIFTMQSIAYGNIPDTFTGFWQQLITTGIGEKSQDPGGLNNRFIIKSVIPLTGFLLLLAGISKILKIADGRKDG